MATIEDDLSRLSNRELKKQISRETKTFRELQATDVSTEDLRAGRGEELLARMEDARQSHDAASKELHRREYAAQRREWTSNTLRNRDLREREDAKKARAKTREALQIVSRHIFASYDTENVTEEEGAELLALARAQYGRDEVLDDEQGARFQVLVAQAAGDPDMFERQRREQALREKQTTLAEQARVESLPVRTFTGKGGAYLPGSFWPWLIDPRDGGMGLVEVGLLATVVLAFENGQQHAPFRGSRFEGDAIVLDAGSGFQLSPPFNHGDDLGALRTREAVVFLARNEWLELSDDGLRLRLGKRAEALYTEGGETNGN